MSSNQRPNGRHFRTLVDERRHEVRGVPFRVKWVITGVRATWLACLVVLVALTTPCDAAAGQFPLPRLRNPFRWRGTLVADSGLTGSVKARAGRRAFHDEPGLLGRFRCQGPGCPGHRGQFYVQPPSEYPPAGGKIYGTMDFGRAPHSKPARSGSGALSGIGSTRRSGAKARSWRRGSAPMRAACIASCGPSCGGSNRKSPTAAP